MLIVEYTLFQSMHAPNNKQINKNIYQHKIDTCTIFKTKILTEKLTR